MHHYRAYGLRLCSDIALPGLPPAEVCKADITVEAAPLPSAMGGGQCFRNWEASPGKFFSHFHEAGRVLVSSGSHIQYDRHAGADDSQITSIILGTSLAAALMQRGIVPMHACSVLTDRGAILVMGSSGAGKSTTLGGLLELGLPMMADDVTGLQMREDGTIMALPAFPAIRLWEDSLAALGQPNDGLVRVRSDINKHYLPVDRFHSAPEPVHALFHIRPYNGELLRVSRLEAAYRVAAISKFIFRKNFIDGMGLRALAFQHAAKLANQAQTFDVQRPPHAISPTQVAKALFDALEDVTGGAQAAPLPMPGAAV